jgi:chromosome segregation ATPase
MPGRRAPHAPALAAALAAALLLAACGEDNDPRGPSAGERERARAHAAAEQAHDAARQAMRAHFFSPTSETCTPSWRAGSLRARAREIARKLDDQALDTDSARGLQARAQALGADIRAIVAVADDPDDWFSRATQARQDLGRLVHSLDREIDAAAETADPAELEALRAQLRQDFAATNPSWRRLNQLRQDPLPRDCLGIAQAVTEIEQALETTRNKLDDYRRKLDTLSR